MLSARVLTTPQHPLAYITLALFCIAFCVLQNPRVLLPSVPELALGAVEGHAAVPAFAKQKFSMWTEEVAAHMKQLNRYTCMYRPLCMQRLSSYTILLCMICTRTTVHKRYTSILQCQAEVFHVDRGGGGAHDPAQRCVSCPPCRPRMFTFCMLDCKEDVHPTPVRGRSS
jgi:hypothetical protein